MRKFLLSSFCFSLIGLVQSQFIPVENPYQSSFNNAYQLYPEIPQGTLEAISWCNTRMTQLTDDQVGSCTGMPKYLGVMGLIENGQNYFNENLKIISFQSGTPVEVMKSDPDEEILAYAKVYNQLITDHSAIGTSVEYKIVLLQYLTEIPLHLNLEGNNYAFDAFLYSIVQFMNDGDMQSYYNFPNHKVDGTKIFGHARWKFLSSDHIYIHPDHIENEERIRYVPTTDYIQQKSADYAPALWNPAASCNYSSRAGTPVSAVTIHDVEGTYSGCISWFQNCASSVSAHYVLRSVDGQITQMVLESNKAWHVGSENPYTVGLEHEGYNNNPAWWTTAMYNSSAALVVDIANDYGINRIRTGWWPWLAATEYADDGIPGGCVRIKGHQHFPNQNHNDPGPFWDWNRYFKLIHPTPTPIMMTAASGNFYDIGGAGGNYVDDERTITTIAPVSASTVTVTFNTFNLENTWDYLYIYDGADITAPLIGYYTGTNNPGTITSSGSSLTFEFRSDCATTGAGWTAVYTSTSAPAAADSIAPVSAFTVANPWQVADFDASFTDSDAGGSGLEKSFYHVSYYDGNGMYANNTRGFLRDEFDLAVMNPQWTTMTGTWNLTGGYLEQNDELLSNTNLYASLKQDLSNIYVYEFSAAIGGSGANRRAGFHFFCDSAQLTNRGNSYFVWLRIDQQTVEIYKVTNDVFSLMHTDNISINADQWYNYKIFYDRIAGSIKVYMDNVVITEWTDPAPYTTGKYVSFRSGNSNYKVNNIKVYRSRYSNAPTTVTVGNCAGCDLPYQNFTPATSAGYIYTFSKDSADNLSAIVNEAINVDWTAPDPLVYVNDISIFDEDTITNNNLAGGNWNIATDTNSAISKYVYAIGTTPGDSNVVDWYDNWFYTNFLDTITLITNQWYYISAKAQNGAGLLSNPTTSDGFIYVNLGNENEPIPTISLYPNPANQFIYLHGFTGNDTWEIEWMDMRGAVLHSELQTITGADLVVDLPVGLSNAFYILRIRSQSQVYQFKVEVVR